MFKIYNEVLIKRIKACIFLMIIIILSQTLGGCYYQENVTYKIDFSLSVSFISGSFVKRPIKYTELYIIPPFFFLKINMILSLVILLI